MFPPGRYVAFQGEGALVMGMDAALLAAAEESGARVGSATLCVSLWRPAAVSLGRFQSVEAAIDAASVASAGYDIVRRPTGGRAVLHDGDVTYTLAARRDDPVFGGSRAESLRAIGEALLAALASLGVRARLESGKPRVLDADEGMRPTPRGRGDAAPPCFESAAREEIQVSGRKLIGSARVEGRIAFLQHGSIPLTASHLRMADLLPGDEASRRAARARLGEASNGLDAIVGRTVDPMQVAGALRAGFEWRGDRRFDPEPLSARELAAVQKRAPAFRIAPAAARVQFS